LPDFHQPIRFVQAVKVPLYIKPMTTFCRTHLILRQHITNPGEPWEKNNQDAWSTNVFSIKILPVLGTYTETAVKF